MVKKNKEIIMSQRLKLKLGYPWWEYWPLLHLALTCVLSIRYLVWILTLDDMTCIYTYHQPSDLDCVCTVIAI